MIIRWDPRSADGFRDEGYLGFVRLGAAVANRDRFLDVKAAPELSSAGTYALFAPKGWKQRWHTGQALPNVIRPRSQEHLQGRWLMGVELVYVGKASVTLKKRLMELLKHGAGMINDRGPHKGGERLWQCAGWEGFFLAWRPCGPDPEPHDTEVSILSRFRELTGKLPFANIRSR